MSATGFRPLEANTMSDAIYAARFTDADRARKDELWNVPCRHWSSAM